MKELLDGRDEGKKSKGRPKNPEKVIAVCETENLFEQLVMSHIEVETADKACEVVFQTKEETKKEKQTEKGEREMMSNLEKETKVVNKLEKESEKLAAKEQEKAEKLLAQQAKEQEKAEKLASKEQEKEYKLLCQKQAKEAEKLLAQQAKEAAKKEKSELSPKKTSKKSLKKAVEEATPIIAIAEIVEATASRTVEATAIAIAKEANDVEYQTKMTNLSAKLESEVASKTSSVMVEEVATTSSSTTLKLKGFKYEGVKYYREKTTFAIYDVVTNDHLGQWDEATQKIDFLEPEEELEEEEESDGESSDEEAEEEEESA